MRLLITAGSIPGDQIKMFLQSVLYGVWLRHMSDKKKDKMLLEPFRSVDVKKNGDQIDRDNEQ